jgi:hypothetical protein
MQRYPTLPAADICWRAGVDTEKYIAAGALHFNLLICYTACGQSPLVFRFSAEHKKRPGDNNFSNLLAMA